MLNDHKQSFSLNNYTYQTATQYPPIIQISFQTNRESTLRHTLMASLTYYQLVALRISQPFE